MIREKKNVQIRQVLKLSGITQKDVAAEIGCSKETLNRQLRYSLELGDPETESITEAIQGLLKQKEKDLKQAGILLNQFLSSGV